MQPDPEALQLATSIIFLAKRHAHFVDTFLQTLFARTGKPFAATLPKEFALELAALLQIAAWHDAGFAEYLDPELPIPDAALRGLWARLMQSPRAYLASKSGTKLMIQVLAAWRKRFASAAVTVLGVDVAVVGDFQDTFLDALADFLLAASGHA